MAMTFTEWKAANWGGTRSGYADYLSGLAQAAAQASAPAAPPRHYLLVEVDDNALERLRADLAGYPGVGVTDYHGPGCCCKNCPWHGNHGWHEEERP